MIVLTPAMAKDLRLVVALHYRTVGTYDYPRGMSCRLRTGRALERRGLVRLVNANTQNRYNRWSPTGDGITYVAVNFRAAEDPFRDSARAKAKAMAGDRT